MIIMWILLGFGILLTTLAQWSYHYFDYEFEDAVMQSFSGIAVIILASFFILYSSVEKN